MEQMRKNAPGRSIWSIFCFETQIAMLPLWIFEEDDDGDDCNRTNRQVYPKTPSPCQAICEHSTEDGSYDGRDAKHAG